MIDTVYLLYPIPSEWFLPDRSIAAPNDVIRDLIVEILASRRRLRKQPNDDRERARSEDTCDLLVAALQSAPRPEKAQVMDRAYGDKLLTQALDGSLPGSLVWEPGQVKAALAAGSLGPERAGLLSSCAQLDEGLAVVPLFVADARLRRPLRPSGRAPKDERPEEPASGDSLEDKLRWRIESGLAGGPPVNMNNQSHVEFTMVFQQYLLAHGGESSGSIRVIYGDGSEAAPFPLRCLQPAAADREERVMPVSLMSMRHLLLDQRVVLNWLRNREIDQSSTLAVSDGYCHQRSADQLTKLKARLAASGLRLHVVMHHTGFEPAVVGFYRAVVESLRDGSDWLRVTPRFYFSPEVGFRNGDSWPPSAGGGF